MNGATKRHTERGHKMIKVFALASILGGTPCAWLWYVAKMAGL